MSCLGTHVSGPRREPTLCYSEKTELESGALNHSATIQHTLPDHLQPSLLNKTWAHVSLVIHVYQHEIYFLSMRENNIHSWVNKTLHDNHHEVIWQDVKIQEPGIHSCFCRSLRQLGSWNFGKREWLCMSSAVILVMDNCRSPPLGIPVKPKSVKTRRSIQVNLQKYLSSILIHLLRNTPVRVASCTCMSWNTYLSLVVVPGSSNKRVKGTKFHSRLPVQSQWTT